MEPDAASRELTVVSLHPGVTREAVQAQCAWTVKFAGRVKETTPPTDRCSESRDNRRSPLHQT
jgi:glutaconate CoA-transferase subunit B